MDKSKAIKSLPWLLVASLITGGGTFTYKINDALDAEIKFSNGVLETIVVFSKVCDK